MELSSFELLKIDIVEEWFPKIPKGLVLLDLKNCKWGFSFYFTVKPYKPGFVKLLLTTTYEVQENDNPDGETICFLTLANEFKVSDLVDVELKVMCLGIFLEISTGHHQSIFAEKNKDNFMADFMVSMFDKTTFTEVITNIVQDDWK